MKKNNMKIKKIIGLVVISMILSSCNSFKSVDIGDVNGVNFKGMVDNKISLELQIPISNPNGFKIKIKSMDLNVTVNGNYIGEMKNANEIVIPSKSEEVHNVVVDIYMKNALAGMATFYRMRKSKSFEMEIDGTIKAKAFLKNKTIKVSEKQTVSI